MGKAPKYSTEFIIAAIKEVQSGKSVQEVAKIFGTSRNVIYSWITRAKQGRYPGFTLSDDFDITPPPKYPDEFKIAAVRRVEAGESIVAVAREINVSRWSLTNWCIEFRSPDFAAERGAEEAQQIVDDAHAQDAQKMEAEAEAERLKQKGLQETGTRIQQIVADPLIWMQKYTETKDSHWRERGARMPYRPFPDKPYFRPAIEDWQREPVVFIEKSRNMMLSWLCVGFFTHAAMTTPGIEILFQSQKEDKAFELVDYAKVLYDHQSDELKEAFPLVKKLRDMADGELLFSNGSRIIGIPGGADQIRSYHPWGLLMDEAAFMPEAGDSYNNAVPVCQKILMVSSAGPGWFAEVCNSGEPQPDTSAVHGFTRKRAEQGLIQRVHYSADPDRGAQWVAEERAKYTSQGKWDREQEIVHEAGAGEPIFAEVFSKWEEKILIDPADGFQVPPYWKRIAAFDHGKANPTAALVAAVDHDANLYILSEYYQPGLSPRQHRPNLLTLDGFMQCDALADPSIFYKSQIQTDGSFKAIVDIYIQEGIGNLVQAPDNSEETGMERILNHWLDLDHREPTLRIVCPRGLRDIGKPVYGVHNEGCPNLLWELKRTRREELSAAQLQRRNPTEKIVDRDNHLRDCLKYLCLAFIDPPKPTPQMIAAEATKDIPIDDATSRMIRGVDALLKAEQAEEAPMIAMGRRGQYNLMRYKLWDRQRKGLALRNLFRDPSEKG
jgi:transposase-like protein